MRDDDQDIAGALPKAPFPAPARRGAAIAEAMRRFDGAAPSPAAAWGGSHAQARPWRTRFNRPQAGALAGALLVALIALPLAWSSIPDPVRDRGVGGRAGEPAAIADPAAEPGSKPPPADAALDAAEAGRSQLPAAPANKAPEAASVSKEVSSDIAPAEASEAVVRGSGIRQPSKAPPVPVTAVDSDEIVITGTRIRRPNLDSPVPITSIGGEQFVQPAEAVRRRGDWNACTVDDPRRDLRACRRDVASVARGAAGRASDHLAEGLSRAWEGELEEAAGAFDRAIAIAPRSSAAYLNRGLVRRSLGDSGRALADLDRAIAYAPRSARGYYHRGLLLRQSGDSRRARADEERAIELDPRYAAIVRAGRKQAR